MLSYKKILRTKVAYSIICWIAAKYIKLISLTIKWKYIDKKYPEKLWKNNENFILCFWHGRLLMMPFSWKRGKNINMLISEHPDGQLISKTVKYFGINTIHGSSSKGGTKALRNIIKTLRSGQSVGITPDGPRGPRMKMNSAIIKIAGLTGYKILPLSCSVKNKFFLNSWDKFLVALPFGKGCFVWGKPLKINKDISKKQDLKLSNKLENILIKLTKEADHYCS
ncbi:MAG: hypothetical protein CFH26_00872 [Alphaproteobacteria bacterium MarineAlpha6_Bin4]|nr:MAG: hypothetical protein CFH25_00224 [Alphaproteobacteria bacterium MarineAlpha6_Bin3]PPR37168.1 MAG: hypothetical protein CFH26_00872 [Alphaproteobacteria bacterium MarineAlpha6_Bin4]